MYKTVEIQSERLTRMVAAYVWEKMQQLRSFAIIWWSLQWGFRGLFNKNKIQNPNPERWKANNFVDPVLGSFVYQLPGV